MTGIAPGAYVRAVSGMYRGAEGRVVRIDVSASGPYAVVDVGEAQPIAVFVTGLELVGAVPTAEQERDAAIAERDETIAAYRDTHAVALLVQDERDRLRRELGQLRNALMGGPNDDVAEWADAILRGVKIVHPTGGHEARIRRELEALRDDLLDTPQCAPLADRLDAILRGGES